MRPSRLLWRTALLFALGAFLVGVPLQNDLIKKRPEQYRHQGSRGFGLGRVVGPTPVLIASLGGFRTVAADLLWLKVEGLSEGGSSHLLPQVFESVVELDPHFTLAWTIYGWHLAYNLNADSILAADKRGYLEDGLAVLRRGMEANPDSYDVAFNYGWTLFDRAHDLYPAAEAFYQASTLKGAESKAIRFRYRCYEHLADIKRLWPALKEAQKQFPHEVNHQRICAENIEWWTTHANDPWEHRRQIVNENTRRRQRALDFYLYPDNPYWNVCPLCGMPTAKGEPVCGDCLRYSFAEKRILPPPGGASL